MPKGQIGKRVVGRPSKYDEPVILQKTREYIDSCGERVEEFHKTRGEKSDSYERVLFVKIPKYEGLALALGISVDSIKEWSKIHSKFSSLIDEMLSKQLDMIADGGASGRYNPVIAKVFMARHGYRDATDSNVEQKTTIVFDTAFNQ